MTIALFLDDPYLRHAEGTVQAVTPDGGIVLDRSVFYATGGGQPGDLGRLTWGGGSLDIADTRKGQGDDIVLIPVDGSAPPPVGTVVEQALDWDRRLAHMRMHTALHLLSVVIPLPVTGGQIGAGKSRLDFLMETPPPDKQALEDALNALVARDLPVSQTWITEAELDANPGLVKTLSVQPPKGAGRVRLVRIGAGEDQVDLQPCGGTHVSATGQIGRLRLGKIENKGRNIRRVAVHFEA